MHGQLKGNFVRMMYIIGIIIDTLVGIDLLQAIVTGQSFVIFLPSITTATSYLQIQVATFMFGWSALLYWGYRKPIDRRSLLLMTPFPIVSGLLLSNIFALVIGLGDAMQIIRNIAIQVALIFGFSTSFYFAETYARRKAKI